MSHVEALDLDINKLIEFEPIQPTLVLTRLAWVFVFVGLISFGFLWSEGHLNIAWGTYYVSLLFFMGLSLGGTIIAVIFQIVRAQWSPPVRRIAEANVAFFPWAMIALLATFFGKDYLFPWATEPMPGREWWMQPEFVYSRFLVLFTLLFFLLWRFVRRSLRTDVGMIQEHAKGKDKWDASVYNTLTRNWRGTLNEVRDAQPSLSRRGPVMIVAYVVVYSLFAFEMVMGMDKIWYSNMFGGFMFIGNLYCGWASLCIWVSYLYYKDKDYASTLKNQQFWDLGKLTFGFGILWGYLFLCQFLPQWYGNLPEETQWMILRTREYPWKVLGWTVLTMCFLFPFITLLSRDVKKTPKALSAVCCVILAGMWLERYVLVMPQLSPAAIPLGLCDLGIFLGFLGTYFLSVSGFLSTFPFIPVASPLTQGSTDW